MSFSAWSILASRSSNSSSAAACWAAYCFASLPYCLAFFSMVVALLMFFQSLSRPKMWFDRMSQVFSPKCCFSSLDVQRP